MKAYVINLDSRTDRWDECQHLPFELERFPAHKNTEGWRGLISTMHELFTTRYTGEAMLIFEDDAQWVRPKSHFDQALKKLPKGYDMLMLGANIKQGASRVNHNVYRVRGAWTTHAVLYSPKFIERLIPILPTLTVPIDEYFRTVIHPEGHTYVVRPMVCYQRISFSDIEGAMNDYTHFFEASNKMMY